MALDADTADWIRLASTEGLGPIGQRKLLAALGSAGAVTAASHAQLAAVVGERFARAVRMPGRGAAIEAALAWAAQPGNAIVTLADAEYPQALLTTPDPPIVLYVRGRLDLLQRDALAIVGSRSATAQGLQNAERFAQTFSAHGFTIVSGLALGIDAAAHRGALRERGASIGVVATGIDIVYPKRNRALYDAMAERGAIISEAPLGTPPAPVQFPRRNRLISGLARGCLVVEAALESGSLITARYAAEQGRDVFALPGSIHSPLSKGCHALIKQGAKLVECAADVLDELGARDALAQRDDTPAPSAAPRALDLLAAMSHDPVHIDTLCGRLGLTPDVVSAMLLALEIEGAVAALTGGRYQRLS
jgi:DNA processing protein